ncbi:DoxX family protein [Maritalea porphyrae]|jgi:putative oxidoreductase|uniref:DoxX family protein n=1 Tax=Maritalea porphyrae TaxID=880732 RepID=UPI0022AF4025|nr:DoxX family protein [Maritalea porphyrae]MCZ4272891.1 DoxX family protein [Maritalea porphyrae]
MLGTVFGRFDRLHMFGLPGALVGSAILLWVRFFLGMPYWNSGWTKWSQFPFSVNSSAKYLFSQEYKLHIFGSEIPFPAPELLAHFAGLGEVILPVFLIAGLFSRFAALGLLGMTAVIQLVYPGAWMIHASWALAALVVIVVGPGMFSVDEAVRRVLKIK